MRAPTMKPAATSDENCIFVQHTTSAENCIFNIPRKSHENSEKTVFRTAYFNCRLVLAVQRCRSEPRAAETAGNFPTAT